MKLILSTLSSPNRLVFTQNRANGSKEVVKSILINGGANVVDKRTMITPAGVITELTDEEYAMVISSAWYKRQNAGGFVRPVESKSEAEEPKKKGMKSKDNSAQKTDSDYGVNNVKVKTGKPSDDVE